jgi:hypothetical protein
LESDDDDDDNNDDGGGDDDDDDAAAAATMAFGSGRRRYGAAGGFAILPVCPVAAGQGPDRTRAAAFFLQCCCAERPKRVKKIERESLWDEQTGVCRRAVVGGLAGPRGK